MRTIIALTLFTLVTGVCGSNLATANTPNAKAQIATLVDTKTSTQQGSHISAVGSPPAHSAIHSKQRGFVGAQACVSCHQAEHQLWQGSHHDLAMQKANSQTVLGNFDNATFTYFELTSTFYKKQIGYFVKTDGPDGKLTDYRIAYTFGVYPLQQYLIELPNGKLQLLSIVWDTRPKSEGGQRWYHLYPEQNIQHDDELHWTGINQNWNFMCADCHSTNLQKNYSLETQSYSTTWSDIDVACEACHGPGENHIQWAQRDKEPSADKKPSASKEPSAKSKPSANEEASTNKGLFVSLTTGRKSEWKIDPATGNATPQAQMPDHSELRICARCHSRRATGFADTLPQHKFLDDFRPALLTEPLYHPDGQINDEVYVYGSFIQSKMYHAGVTCSNCHEPHSTKLRLEGNNLCAQCHAPSAYDRPKHHLHTAESAGAQCVNCHMPTKTYMGVDVRRDHSFRIPRPDLSEKLGTPNACTQCHDDKSPSWAVNVLTTHKKPKPPAHFAEALHAGRQRSPDAERLLSELIMDTKQPAIARATALSLLPAVASQQSAPLLQMAAHDEDPLIGLGLVSGLNSIPDNYRAAFAVPMLYDASRINQSLAASALAGISLEAFPEKTVNQYNEAAALNQRSELFNSDRPESLINLADSYFLKGNADEAKRFYQLALKTAPHFAGAYINFADYYRQLGNDKAAELLLKRGIDLVYEPAPLNHALGLVLIRQQRYQQSLTYLAKATQSPNATARYFYVYAVALESVGEIQPAIDVLSRALELFPNDADIKSALDIFTRKISH